MLLKSMFSAFLMYSRIPVPQVEWKEQNRRYSLCFFPVIGAVIGGLFLLWRLICSETAFNDFMTGAVSTLIPVIVTGGIHIDGFCDVTDAKSSYGDFEKRLAVMKDSHIGAFAVINLCMYFIIQTAMFSQVSQPETSGIIAVGYVLSRALSGLTAVTFRTAKKNGSLQSFTEPAHRKITITVLAITVAVCVAVMILLDIFSGTACTLSAVGMVMYYRRFAYKTFGGITGDLSGWFLQMCEILILSVAVICETVML